MGAEQPDRDRLNIYKKPLAAVIFRIKKFNLAAMNNLKGIDAVHGLIREEPIGNVSQLIETEKRAEEDNQKEQHTHPVPAK